MINRNVWGALGWVVIPAAALLMTACGPSAVPPEPTRAPAPTFTPTPLVQPAPVAPPPAEQPPAVAPVEQPPAAQPVSEAPSQPAEQPAQSAPEPAPTDTPVPVAEVVINSNMNVRGGPGTNYNVVGAATQGQRYRVTGRNNDSSWWEIDFNGRAGWVFGQLVTPQNTQAVALAANIPAPPPPPPPTATPVPPPPQEAPPPAAPPPPPADNFPFLLLEGVERCDPNIGFTYFEGYVRYADNSPMNGVCVHIDFFGPRGTKCSGCDGVGDGNWGFSPFGGPAPRGTYVEIFVVPCSGPMPMGGQTQQSGFGDLTPQSKKWTRTIGDSEQCTGITFVKR